LESSSPACPLLFVFVLFYLGITLYQNELVHFLKARQGQPIALKWLVDCPVNNYTNGYQK